MHVLISGGTGFVGRSVLRYLDERLYGQDSPLLVTVLSRNPEAFLHSYPFFRGLSWLRIVLGDVLFPESLPRGLTCTHIIHAATEATRSEHISYLDQYIEIAQGARNMLDLAVEIGASRFLLTSSGAAYGPQPPDSASFVEDMQGSLDLDNPANAYGLGKRAAEHLCALYSASHGLETVVARCFAFLGPDLPLNAHYAIGNFIADALSGRDIIVNGDGAPLRTYLDQADMAHWLWTLLLEGKAGDRYNVGSDEVISIGDLAHLVRDLVCPGKTVQILGRGRLCHSRSRYIPSIEKVTNRHSLEVTVPLAESIRNVALYHRGQSAIP